MTTPGHGQRSGSVYCVWTRSAPTRPSSRGSDQAIRSSWLEVASSIASMPAGHELGVPRHGGDAQPRGRGRLGQLAEQVEDVGLVAGAVAAEHVGVDDDERIAHASSRQSDSSEIGGVRPREPTGTLEPEPAQLVVPRFGLRDACRDRIRVERVDEHGRAARHLLRSAASRRDDRRPARHRLDHRQPEALVEGREHEAPRAPVERSELLVVDAPGPAGYLDPTPARRPHDPQLDARPLRRLDRAAEVLARLERSHREHVVARRPRPRLGEDGLEPVRDDANPLDGNVEQLDELVTRERRDGDDRVGASRPRGASATRPVCRCQGGKASGCRSKAQSWTVTTTGSFVRSGPRIVVQWSTSADRASCAMPNGYHARSRTTVAARP